MSSQHDRSPRFAELGQLIAAGQAEHLEAQSAQRAQVRRAVLSDHAGTAEVSSSLFALGQTIDRVQAESVAVGDTLRQVRARLLAPPRARFRLQPLVVGALSFAAVVLLAVGGLRFFRPAPLGFEVGGSAGGARPGQVGQWISAAAADETTLRFSDGSTLALHRETGLRVQEVSADGARISLERGAATVYVVPRANARWRLAVGPFVVRVVGTRFRVAWDPGGEAFSLRLDRGAVEVQGPSLRKRLVVAGELVRVWVRERRMEVRRHGEPKRAVPKLAARLLNPPPAEPDAGAGADAGSDLQAPLVAKRIRRVTRPRKRKSKRGKPKAAGPVRSARSSAAKKQAQKSGPWTLARAGRYGAALRQAQRIGWSSIERDANASQLLALADAARLGGRPARARSLLTLLRRRFPRSREARAACFGLGRLAFDSERDFRAALHFFRRYSKLAPKGPFAAAARGRSIEAHLRLGEREAACRASREYLRYHGEGPHATLARRLIARCR